MNLSGVSGARTWPFLLRYPLRKCLRGHMLQDEQWLHPQMSSFCRCLCYDSSFRLASSMEGGGGGGRGVTHWPHLKSDQKEIYLMSSFSRNKIRRRLGSIPCKNLTMF